MWCNSFPEYVRKRPRVHEIVLGFARRPLMENALGFSLVSPFLVNRRFRSAVWPQNRNRRSDLMHLNISGLILRFDRRLRNRRMKPPIVPCLSRDSFCGYVLRPRPQNETADRAFSGAKMYFHALFFGLYKYILISGSQTKFLIPRTLERYLERLERKTLKITSLFLSTHFHMHISSSKHHLGSSSMC